MNQAPIAPRGLRARHRALAWFALLGVAVSGCGLVVGLGDYELAADAGLDATVDVGAGDTATANRDGSGDEHTSDAAGPDAIAEDGAPGDAAPGDTGSDGSGADATSDGAPADAACTPPSCVALSASCGDFTDPCDGGILDCGMCDPDTGGHCYGQTCLSATNSCGLCHAFGDTCGRSGDCCTGCGLDCNPTTGQCCHTEPGAPCFNPTDCCNGNCDLDAMACN